MLVLTVNPGSSSLRAHLVDTTDNRVVDAAEIEHPADSDEARRELRDLLGRTPTGAITAVGHRLVHGGQTITEPVAVDNELCDQVRELTSLAPLHVPNTVALLDFLREEIPERPHVLCPDTAFHNGLPEAASTYALPRQWREQWGLRRYGFHGLSFAWALGRAAELLGKPAAELNLLIAHLSGGSSVCAVRGGRSVDTSMGFTPLEGLVMAKRAGTVDPGLLVWLLREKKLSVDELERGLQKESGLLGLSGGFSEDTRDLVPAAREGDDRAALALNVFAHRARRELAGVAASLDRIDGLVLTGDIGWDQPELAEDIAAGLGILGFRGDLDTARDEDAVLSRSGVPVLTVRSREELQLAMETARAAQPSRA
ncbi:acetate/propionate family kinase [Amycolatopsis sp. 195334CR]|uniref:acetate/propionate family kinase n=1 Tax=Amycolatopsis sp. 195334CR TaxID=2814588 RepID=UPI001A905FA3|nr:acetate/propionate family kinase [Amycolatopsis sp. 195334CR]MBN6041349.1 acetate/propionate family kinase [Amycolatopsis sp. 195334CR]